MTAAAAAGASVEPLPPSESAAKTEAKSVSAAGKIAPRAGRRSTVVTAEDTKVTYLPEGAERSSIVIRGPHVWKLRKSDQAKQSPSKTAFSGRGTSPTEPTPDAEEERLRSPQARVRKILTSSTWVRLLDPLRSCSVAGSGKYKKSAFPLALPLWNSRVQSNAVRDSSHR